MNKQNSLHFDCNCQVTLNMKEFAIRITTERMYLLVFVLLVDGSIRISSIHLFIFNLKQ
jgi:hypothetical protein